MSNKLLILADAVAACCAAAQIAFSAADHNSAAVAGWTMALMWIFVDMLNWIDGLPKKGGAE